MQPSYVPHVSSPSSTLAIPSRTPDHSINNVPPSLSPTSQSQPGDQNNPGTNRKYSNSSTQLLLEWMWSGSDRKSLDELNTLVHRVLRDPSFSLDDLVSFDARTETAKLDAQLEKEPDTWKETVVTIQVPDGKPHPGGEDVPCFPVLGLVHRSLTAVIRTVWSNPASNDFHYIPFRQFYQRPSPPNTDPEDGHGEPPLPPQRVYDELYTSEAFNVAHEALQDSPPEPNCDLERVICALMFWSDSTHLANFGDAALWPLYLFYGNQSKYTRGRPTSGACHHVAYIPKVCCIGCSVIWTGLGPNADVLTHCRRELMHEVWRVLLDDDFMHAYSHGLVIECADGIMRRVYPRMFTYSADYPEKVLLATLRNLGAHPCPRCTIPKEKIPELGMKRDDTRRVKQGRTHDHQYKYDIEHARKKIYEGGVGVKSKYVEDVLSKESYVPTSNAFVDKFTDFGQNIFSFFVVDLMHEFELGVFKSVFIHLIRMLISIGDSAIQRFNERYVSQP
ncbi:hypothetical protein K474DRAFT_1610237 [Panus rudis PR-1116 ss-1]|nr:hypothetical protein K474DRAFT_1610237 [Panus rudis PR-1116 ss-1]